MLKKFGFENQAALPNAEHLGDYGFYIPNGLGMSDSDANRVIDVVRQILG